MRNNLINVLIFLMLAGGMYFLWQHTEQWFPKPQKKEEAKKESADGRPARDGQKPKEAAERGKALAALGGGLASATDLPQKPKEPPKVGLAGPPSPPPSLPEPPTLIALGEDGYYTKVLLTTRGGAVQQVVLTRFEEADRLGKPVKDAAGNPVPLYLIPGEPQPRGKELREPYQVPTLKPGKVAPGSVLSEPSYAVFHYPTPDDKYPDPLLGEANWTRVSEEHPPGGEHKVIFEAELGDPYFVKFRKTYTLGPKDYHVGLQIEITRLPGGKKGAGQLRYQLAGPHGLPIEGEWYNTTYRNAVIGWVDAKGTARRQLEDAAGIGAKRGGEAVSRGDNLLKYMAVQTQYFTSAAAVDNNVGGAAANPWAYVRATTEIPLGHKQDPNQPYFDDITVRAASETLDLEPGKSVVHSYLLYNGPSKVRLLKLMPEGKEVDKGLVDRYMSGLTLQTITDYRSDNPLGRFASFIYWTDLVIVFTNLMHLFLAAIHSVIGNWALSIVVLTVCVRLLLFYPSRKQTAMSMKMMEVQKRLQPEFDKLYEKYKDDLNAYNREKTRLMMQHGANPFAAMGGCLLLLAQMPIMMGLYFCLQESVFFRLDHFLWIDNLAAPDMLVWWGEHIPYVSTPEDLGSFIYLGPYFNILPVLAVGLMLYQQAKMMPPSTDPQAEQQRVMMKVMMVMMAFFFYKVAAGLALYFIVSTTWGIIERQFIPKPKIDLDTPSAGAPPAGSPNDRPGGSAAPERSKGRLGRLREALQKKLEEAQKRADEMSRRQIRNDPNRPGGDQGGPGGGGQQGGGGGGGGPRRDRDKKKRRK